MLCYNVLMFPWTVNRLSAPSYLSTRPQSNKQQWRIWKKIKLNLQCSGDKAFRQQSQASRRNSLSRPLGPLDVRWRWSRRRVVRMFDKNFASSPNQLALFLVYITIWLRSDAVLAMSLSREYFVARMKRPRAASWEGQSKIACHSESMIRFPVWVKQVKQQRLKRSLASNRTCLQRQWCALCLAKYSSPAKVRISTRTALMLADGFFMNNGFSSCPDCWRIT